MKNIIYALAVTILYFANTSSVFAFTYDRSPSGSPIDSPVTFQVTASSIDVDNTGVDNWNNCLNNGDIGFCYITIYISGTSDLRADECTVMSESEDTYFFNVSLPYNFNAGDVEIKYSTESTCTDGIGYSGDLDTFVINSEVIPPTPNQSIWAGDNGFWGSTTVTDVSDGIEASVQATGVNVYSLLTYVGIPVGFIIAGYLIMLINKTLTPEQKTKKNKDILNPKGEKFIEHTPKDLEFIREYGQEKPKRKRGRPRKQL